MDAENPAPADPLETPAPPPAPLLPPDPDDPASSLAADLLSDAPTPSPGFVARIKGGTAKIRTATAPADQMDKEGFIFDRRFCVLGHNNRPRKSAGGLWEMRRDPETKKRYVRPEVLRRSGDPVDVERPQPQAAPRPKLDLPGGDDSGTETGEDIPGFDAGAAPAPAINPDAVALGMVIDSLFWSGAQVIALPDIVAQVQRTTQEPARSALIAGLNECQDLPRLPWWAPVLVIYSSAAVAMYNHPHNEKRRLTLKEKLARWWLNLKSRHNKAPEGKEA